MGLGTTSGVCRLKERAGTLLPGRVTKKKSWGAGEGKHDHFLEGISSQKPKHRSHIFRYVKDIMERGEEVNLTGEGGTARREANQKRIMSVFEEGGGHA